MRRLLSSGIVLVVVIALTSCMKKAAIWIVSGSQATDLVFGIAAERGREVPIDNFGRFDVRTCYRTGEERVTMWSLSANTQEAQPAPTKIKYGDPPKGFYETAPPAALRAGCYEASISGSGLSASVRFLVDSTGSVSTRTGASGA